MLSRTTNGLSLQCTHALNRHRTISGVWAIDWIPMEMFTPTHALHNVRRRLVQNLEHFSGQRCSGRRCNNSTMSGGACAYDSLLKDNRSTMSGGGRRSIDNRLESPKHRVSLGLHMNYYVHRKQYAQSQWNTVCHMRRKQCTLKQFETMALTRQSK